jgi:hypothetical protein
LLNAKNKAKKFSESCAETLESRKELWNLAGVSDSLNGLNDLARIINESQNRSYFFLVILTVFVSVFLMGCCCKFRWKQSHRKKI